MGDRYPFDFRKIIEHQDEMKDIVEIDTINLASQTEKIDETIDGKQRMALISYSQNRRNSEYNKMMIICLIAIIISIGIYSIHSFFPILPQLLIILIISIVYSISLIKSYYIYSDVKSRSRINYDELQLDPMPPSTNNADRADRLLSGNLLGSINIGGCIGSSCCSDGTMWNINTNNCMIPCTSTGVPDGTWDGYTFTAAIGSSAAVCELTPTPP
jgi:hypothetical protein